jgi:hypothetical protein
MVLLLLVPVRERFIRRYTSGQRETRRLLVAWKRFFATPAISAGVRILNSTRYFFKV